MLVDQCGATFDELDNLLEYAGLFLSNMGNYFASTLCPEYMA